MLSPKETEMEYISEKIVKMLQYQKFSVTAVVASCFNQTSSLKKEKQKTKLVLYQDAFEDTFFVCSIVDHMQLLLLCNEKNFEEFDHYKVFSSSPGFRVKVLLKMCQEMVPTLFNRRVQKFEYINTDAFSKLCDVLGFFSLNQCLQTLEI